MQSHARVAVTGGGVVGRSVLYHFVRLGGRDVMLIERPDLISSSTWHAAGGFHILNADTRWFARRSGAIRRLAAALAITIAVICVQLLIFVLIQILKRENQH